MKTLFCLSLFVCFTVIEGASVSIPEPMYGGIREPMQSGKNGISATKEQLQYFSKATAQLGWQYLFQKNDPVTAMKRFNQAWLQNPQNYEAYWGFGIIRGMQAESSDKSKTEKYLNESADFFLKAIKCEVPANLVNRLHLDLANSYNGLGVFYQHEKKQAMSEDFFNKAKTILVKITKEEPENGRAFFLLSANYFYSGKYDEAKKQAETAENKHFKLPEAFVRELAEKVTAEKQDIATSQQAK